MGSCATAVDVLLVDDEEDVRMLITEILSRAGYTVRTAADGRDAIEKLDHITPSVIIMDLQMPVMNGAEFRQAQRRNREWIKIPTVVMTGTTDEPLLDLAIEETLKKPVRAVKLLEIVGRHAPHT